MTEGCGAGKDSGTKKILILSVLGVVLLGAGLYGLGLVFNWVPAWYQNYQPIQPIPYSHKLHAGQYKMPCLYCHGSAEWNSFAEVPGLETCMNCHQAVKVDSPWIKQMAEAYKNNQPIKWVKVHVLPDFVRFNHRRHVSAGLQCQTCHGPIQEMEVVRQWAPLNMAWCVNCHRDNNYVQPSRQALAEKKAEMRGDGETPKLIQWMQETKVLAHPGVSNADVSCSTCHY